MATCKICSKETALHVNGKPICAACDKERDRQQKDRLIETAELERQRVKEMLQRNSS